MAEVYGSPVFPSELVEVVACHVDRRTTAPAIVSAVLRESGYADLVGALKEVFDGHSPPSFPVWRRRAGAALKKARAL